MLQIILQELQIVQRASYRSVRSILSLGSSFEREASDEHEADRRTPRFARETRAPTGHVALLNSAHPPKLRVSCDFGRDARHGRT
jgi:hypothetical protein